MGVAGKENKEREAKGKGVLAHCMTWNKRVETGDKSKNTHRPGVRPEGPEKWQCRLTWDCWVGVLPDLPHTVLDQSCGPRTPGNRVDAKVRIPKQQSSPIQRLTLFTGLPFCGQWWQRHPVADCGGVVDRTSPQFLPPACPGSAQGLPPPPHCVSTGSHLSGRMNRPRGGGAHSSIW